MVEILSKISQGTYQKEEFKKIISPEQEIELKQKALKSLVYMMRSLVNFYKEYEKNQENNQEITDYSHPNLNCN